MSTNGGIRPAIFDDILWVRETWAVTPKNGNCRSEYLYRADYGLSTPWEVNGWKPSIHMPKEAARIFLRVTEVRAERLQDISDDGAIREGAKKLPCEEWAEKRTERDAFAQLWDSTIKPRERSLYGWEANPWVWVIEFERCEKPKEEYNYE